VSKKVILFFLLALAIVTIGIILINRLPGKLGEKKSDQSLLGAFATTLKDVKPSSQEGIVADPPREALKRVEQFVKGIVTKDGRADYQFTEYLGENQYNHRISLYVSATPFRWRVDFSTPSVNTQSIYIQDGSKYYACSSDPEDKGCSILSSLDDLGTPIPLTEYLNSLVDPVQLKKFISGTRESREATFENTVKTIVTKSTDCVRGTDEYGEVEFCIDQESGMPLLISLKTKLRRYILEAQAVDSSPLSADVFSPPYQLYK
jgi:hypothetical protein